LLLWRRQPPFADRAANAHLGDVLPGERRAYVER
jgi:hypothetical protein